MIKELLLKIKEFSITKFIVKKVAGFGIAIYEGVKSFIFGKREIDIIYSGLEYHKNKII